MSAFAESVRTATGLLMQADALTASDSPTMCSSWGSAPATIRAACATLSRKGFVIRRTSYRGRPRPHIAQLRKPQNIVSHDGSSKRRKRVWRRRGRVAKEAPRTTLVEPKNGCERSLHGSGAKPG